ncbi:MAG: hypothetical protein Q4C76_05895 [Bacillota bacterium]|nr:hypothetical protein [Bacillota bacterium]
MKKKLLALACAVGLILSLMVVPSSASNSLFFLSLNDTLAPQSAQTTPIQHSGWVYVPVTAFNNRVTGINFGVYYGFTDNNESLIFYNLSGKTMTFDLINGTATATGGDPPVPGRVVWQNGVYYVPAYAICRYFGLTYSFYTTDYGPLLRIKDGSAVLSDSLFISSAASMMRGRYNSYYGQNGNTNNNNTNTPPTPTTPTTPVTPPQVEEPNVVEENAPKFSLYLGLRAAQGTDITAALNALANVNASAVVFFPADTLAASGDQIRQAAGRGHKVGLIPAGETAEERLRSVREGQALLTRILRQETWFVLAGDKELADAGYLCWSPGLTTKSGGTSTQIYESIVDYGEGQKGGRVLLDTRTSGPILAGVLNQLAQDGDTFLVPRETKY